MSNPTVFEQLFATLATNATAHKSDVVLDEDDCAAIVSEVRKLQLGRDEALRDLAEATARAEKAEAELAKATNGGLIIDGVGSIKCDEHARDWPKIVTLHGRQRSMNYTPTYYAINLEARVRELEAERRRGSAYECEAENCIAELEAARRDGIDFIEKLESDLAAARKALCDAVNASDYMEMSVVEGRHAEAITAARAVQSDGGKERGL